MKYYKEKYKAVKNQYKNAEIISKGSISIPIHPGINFTDINYIYSLIKQFLKGYEKNINYRRCWFIGHNLGLNLCKKDYEVYIVDSLAVIIFFQLLIIRQFKESKIS